MDIAISIPHRLRQENIRFCLVGKQDKKPFESQWQKNGYTFDDNRLIEHISKGGNYGVIGGYDNIVVVDFDNPDLQQNAIKDLPETFTIRTGGKGLYHLYFRCYDDTASSKLLDVNSDVLADIQGTGKMVVGANCIHPSGSQYEVVKDIEIAPVNMSELKAIFDKYVTIEEEQEQAVTNANTNANTQGYNYNNNQSTSPEIVTIKEKISVPDLLQDYGVDTSKNPTMCPFGHPSQGGKCLTFRDRLFNCFHCNKGGDIFNLVMEKEGWDFSKTLRYLSKKAGVELPERKESKKGFKFWKKDRKQADDEKEKAKTYTSSMITDDAIYQQIYNPETNMSSFLKYTDDGTIEQVGEFEHQSITYKPLFGEELPLGVVLLPTKAEDYSDTTELFKEIKDHINKYVDVESNYELLASWYVLLTWVYDRFHTINYLRAIGDTGCGKTRTISVIGGLCYNATKGSGATSVSAIKRITQKWKGTIIVDEGDFKESNEKSELVKYFNLGFEKNSPMMNSDKNEPSVLEFFIPFCPKIISTRKYFTDKALESRCLTQKMYQTTRSDIPYILPDRFYKEQQDLRNKLLMFRFRNYKKIDISKDVDFGDMYVEPRLKQATHSFASLFANIPEMVTEFRKYLEMYQQELIEERASSYDGNIINAFVSILNDRNEGNYDGDEDFRYVITSQDVAERMLADFGSKTTSRTVGKHLKVLGFGSQIFRKEKTVKRRIIIVDFDRWVEIAKRYVTDKYLQNQVTSVTFVTFTMAHTDFTYSVMNKQKEGAEKSPSHLQDKNRYLQNQVTTKNGKKSEFFGGACAIRNVTNVTTLQTLQKNLQSNEKGDLHKSELKSTSPEQVLRNLGTMKSMVLNNPEKCDFYELQQPPEMIHNHNEKPQIEVEKVVDEQPQNTKNSLPINDEMTPKERVWQIIKNQTQNNNLADIELIVKIANFLHIAEDFVESELVRLKGLGYIFEPRSGFIQIL